MKQAFFLILIVLSIQSNAQVWVNSNAVWTYGYSGLTEGGSFRWRYMNDTVIQDRSVQVISCEKHQFVYDQFGQLQGNIINNGNYYTSVSGDTVFYLNNNQFYVLYNFGANIGDQWIIAENPNTTFCNSVSSVQVTDTGTFLINGQVKRTITLSTLTTGDLGMDGLVIEGIGLINGANFGLFPGVRDCPGSSVISESYEFDFRCFSDDSLGIYQQGILDCDYLIVSINESNSEVFSVYPNPSCETIQIKNLTVEKTFTISDFKGEKVIEKKIIPNHNYIDISELKNGIYLLNIGNQKIKFIKYS